MDQGELMEFLRRFDRGRYPSALLKSYELMECLSNSEAGETLLAKDRNTDRYAVVKCYTDASLLSHTTESDLLRKLSHPGLPAFMGEYMNEDMLCVVREYSRGIPLYHLLKRGRLPEHEILSICLQLCDVLIYLHGQTPPVIHRDIKPQNIIVDESGGIKLIDFGISRIYDENAKNDTVFFGTQEFAPPEQYGFSQTDNRSDIFSFGVVLCWLLTGETDTKKASEQIRNSRLRQIVKKCTAFAPKDRYRNAQSVRKALEKADKRAEKRLLKTAAAGLALVLAASLGFFAGRYTDIGLPPAGGGNSVVFSDPLIEEAVRLQLGKDDSDPVSQEDLLSVTDLYIFGNQAAANREMYMRYNEDFSKEDGSALRGTITSLSDIAMLQNLKRLSLAYQNISDLSPLSQLSYLEEAELKHNPIEDVSPLKKLTSLKGLYLYDTNVSDFSVLRSCTRLESIDAGYTQITSMTAFEGLSALKVLRLDKTRLETLDNVGTLSMLAEIYLSETPIVDISPLLDLPRLKTVGISEDMRGAAGSVGGSAQFGIQYFG